MKPEEERHIQKKTLSRVSSNLSIFLFFFGVLLVCLDGSLPGYHLDPGSGNGAKNWIVHLQVRKKKDIKH